MARVVRTLPLLLAGLISQAEAADERVDLELVLAVDVSRSVDAGEAQLQREGYIEAFRNPNVMRAVRSGFIGKIAVAYVEWAGTGHVEMVVDWTPIDDDESARKFAAALGRAPSRSALYTSISGAIDFALPMFKHNGFEGTRQVIDVSGDGPNNAGSLVTTARDKAVARDITINGLPILDNGGGPFSRYNIADLDLYYRDCVIGGPGAFLVVAADFKDFARAVRRKLIFEIAGRVPRPAARLLPAQATGKARVSPPCDIGEQLLRSVDDF